MTRKLIAVLLLLAAAACAEERRPRKRSRLWLVSLGALVAANFADAHSSWGYPERNGLLRGTDGRFGGRAVAIKTAIIGGAVTGEWLAARKTRGAEAPFAAANFGTAAFLWRTAANNYRIRGGLSLPAPAHPAK